MRSQSILHLVSFLFNQVGLSHFSSEPVGLAKTLLNQINSNYINVVINAVKDNLLPHSLNYSGHNYIHFFELYKLNTHNRIIISFEPLNHVLCTKYVQ